MKVAIPALLLMLMSLAVQLGAQQQLGGSGSGAVVCSGQQFLCQSNGLCISESLVCDGMQDCPRGEDESVCTQLSCSLDQYRCASEEVCVSLQKVCDGQTDCSDFGDEASCGEASDAGAMCELNQYACSSAGPCIPRASLCDGVGDCPNGEDESRCERPEAEMLVPTQISVESGDNITLSCGAMGYPPAFVTWRRNLRPLPRNARYAFTSQNGYGVLRVRDAGLEDAGLYHCEVISRLHGSHLLLESVLVQVTDGFPSQCVDHNLQRYLEGSYYYDLRPVGVGPASQAAADIIFVVDESGSTIGEHDWIRREVQILDQMLKSNGVGAGMRPNLFALVGFSRNNPLEILGVTLTNLTTSSNFVTASRRLMVTGTVEDGYAAIDHALENILTRPGTAKQLILVTDGDRYTLKFDLTRDKVESRLREAGFVLNVVVQQAFQANISTFALGMTNTTAYVFDPLSSRLYFELSAEGVVPSSEITFGNTFEDYVMLALSLGGGAWDINQLRDERAVFSRAFTNAFTDSKVEEVMTVFRYCFECMCRSIREVCSLASHISPRDCMGEYPVLRGVVTPETTLVKRGSTLVLTCLSFNNIEGRLVNYKWIYPPELEDDVNIMNNVLVVNGIGAEANFTCMLELEGTNVTSAASSEVFLDGRCRLPDRSYLVLGDVRLIIVPRDSNQSRAADVVLLVDESGSMEEEHAWISAMTQFLDKALMENGIGISPGNYFGVVGFGDDCRANISLGRVLSDDFQKQFVSAETVTNFITDLNVGGRWEDGYSAMHVALSEYSFRDVARQFILITDEDRDELAAGLTREVIAGMLDDSGVLLNVAISEEFSGDGMRALGVDSSGNAYFYDPSVRSSFRVEEGVGVAVENSGFGSTSTDYTGLAWEVGGAAWDLSQLRQGGGVADAFTNAFVRVKVVEIQSQLSRCLRCMCGPNGHQCEELDGANFTACMRMEVPPRPGEGPLSVVIDPPDRVTVGPSETRSFTCRANASAVIRWTQDGHALPANAVVQDTGGYVSVLTLTSPNADSAGVYLCLVHSQSGVFNSRASVEITFYDVDQDLMLRLSPQLTTVTRGDRFALICTVATTSTIRWTFNDGDLPMNTILISRTNSSELMVEAVDDSSAGAYICTATSADGTLVADGTVHVEVRAPVLRLVVTPDLLNVVEAEPVELTCRVDCFCPDVVPEWNRADNVSLSDLAMSFSTVSSGGANRVTTLLIPQAVVEDTGRYVCSAKLEGVSAVAEAYVAIERDSGRFQAKLLGPSQVEVAEGDHHSLLCQLNQNASSIVWKFDGTAVRLQEDATDSSDNFAPDNVVVSAVSRLQSVLTIIQASSLNSGAYECIATAEADNEVATTNVDVSVG